MKMWLMALCIVGCTVAVVCGAYFLGTAPPLRFGLIGVGVLVGAVGAVLAHRDAAQRPIRTRDGRPPVAGKDSAVPEAADAIGALLDALT